jgi:hypothetical protein
MRTLDFYRYTLGSCITLAILAGCGVFRQAQDDMPSIGTAGTMPPSASVTAHAVPRWHAMHTYPACPQVVGTPICLALIQSKGAQPACVGPGCGWAPIDFQTRYKLPITRGSGQIVAIVDAGDNPDAAHDIATYRMEFGLGAASFYKYNQNGQQGNYPSYTGWSIEIDLDIEMVSATCPLCTIYLVEANTAASADLETAEAEAVTLGAHIVSNSWICYGSVNCVDQRDFDTKGVTYLAAGGDAGSNQVGAPAAFDSVAAIGGTQLAKSGSKYSETIWSGGGGGCATGIKKPNWQSIIPSSVCGYRLTNDAAAEAGCSPGVAEYDSHDGGWFGVCGTSVAPPLLAGVFGLAGNPTKQDGGRTFWRTAHHKELYHLQGQCAYRQGQYTTCGGWGSPDGVGAL